MFGCLTFTAYLIPSLYATWTYPIDPDAIGSFSKLSKVVSIFSLNSYSNYRLVCLNSCGVALSLNLLNAYVASKPNTSPLWLAHYPNFIHNGPAFLNLNLQTQVILLKASTNIYRMA